MVVSVDRYWVGAAKNPLDWGFAAWLSSVGCRHNADLRDSSESTQKQAWIEQILKGKEPKGLVEFRLTEASSIVCFDSTHPTPRIKKQFVYTRMPLTSELWT